MSTILLVQTKPVLAQAVRQLAQHNPDLHVLEAADPDEAVQRTEADPPGVAAVALGAADAEPLRISQRIHGIDRDISVALLAKPGDLPELRKALRMTPFLGGEIRCLSAADPQPTAEAVVEAAERRLQRQSFARATNRLNRRITEAITPPQIAAHFDKLLDRAPIGVVTVDRQGRIAGWNPQAGKLLDTSERRTLGQPLSTLFTSPERERVHDLLMRTITSDQPISEETVDRTSAKGQPQFLELSATAVELNPGTPGAIVLLQDVTAR